MWFRIKWEENWNFYGETQPRKVIRYSYIQFEQRSIFPEKKLFSILKNNGINILEVIREQEPGNDAGIFKLDDFLG